MPAQDQLHENFKAGFVNIIGKPNVGKSTFLNAILGTKLAITTHKAQTTRHRILGILTEDSFQLVFSDTPGFIDDPKYKMQETMVTTVMDALADGDLTLLMVDPFTQPERLEIVRKAIKKTGKPCIVLFNKADLCKPEELLKHIDTWKKLMPQDEVIAVSALHGIDKSMLLKTVLPHIPENPPFYPDEYYTDRNERFIISEIIREKILLFTKDEIPYSVEVVIHTFKEEAQLIRIAADIYVNRKTHKPILIGKDGSMIKKIGTEARKDIEAFLDKQVFLETNVKIRENWRNDPGWLKRFGYQYKKR